MSGVVEYLLSVVGAAMVSTMVLRLLEGKGGAASMGKIVVGIFMVLTVLTPITKVRLSDLALLKLDISADAQQLVAEGEANAKKAMEESISAQIEAYILGKAAQYGVILEVEVRLSDDPIPVPVSVHLYGNISPYAKALLQNILRDDLGIEKENQIWR